MYIYTLYLLGFYRIFRILSVSLYCRYFIDDMLQGRPDTCYPSESPCLSGFILHNNGKLILLLYINGKWYCYRHIARSVARPFEA